MAMPGIEFVIRRPAPPPASTRADVALFVGCIARRPGALPVAVADALDAAGWRNDGPYPVRPAVRTALRGVPVAVESWAEFDALFDWRCRESVPGAGERLPCPLGLAVRRFFRAGGAKAWIIRCGNPLPLTNPAITPEAFRALQLAQLAGPLAARADAVPILPGFRNRSPDVDPLDARTWRGLGAIHALEDVALVLLPDLPELVAGPALAAAPPPEPLAMAEQFRPCAVDAQPENPPERGARPEYLAPRLDRTATRLWCDALSFALAMLGTPRGPAHRRDVMLLASLPLISASEAELTRGIHAPLEWLGKRGFAGTDSAPRTPFSATMIGNARLQLAYPWLATRGSARAPEGLEAPEGALAGMIATSALEQGTFRSVAGRKLGAAARLVPDLAGSDVARGLAGMADWLGARISLFAQKRGGVELISDTTASASPSWQSGGVSRLIGSMLRVCRHLGDELMFEASGPQLWGQVANRVTGVLEQYRQLGAFEGQSAAEAYEVICDRRSMTNADIDAGRVRCDVILNPASPINRIVVTLALTEPLPIPALEAA